MVNKVSGLPVLGTLAPSWTTWRWTTPDPSCVAQVGPTTKTPLMHSMTIVGEVSKEPVKLMLAAERML